MQNVYPTLRITNYEKSKSFYVRGLGFQIDSEHRFAPHLPVFMTICRDGLSLYLSQHKVDCQVGGLVYLFVSDVDAFYSEITGRGIKQNLLQRISKAESEIFAWLTPMEISSTSVRV